jgi:protein farnesyltransferase subunit beta
LCTPQTIQFLIKCQTWEGGFGGEPHNEAHGGYTYCATAALHILGHLNNNNNSSAGMMMMQQSCDKDTKICSVDMDALTCWLAARQKSYEGGFDGRTNKLVDGCYSFWQGAAMAICSMYHYQHHAQQLQQQQQDDDFAKHAASDNDNGIQDDPWLCHDSTAASTIASTRPTLLLDDGMLERYILLCAQDVQGGLRDKPSKRRDFYHSCYCLSGLAIAQHGLQEQQEQPPAFGHASQSLVAATHPCYNLRLERVRQLLQHFHKLGFAHNNNYK